MKIARTVLLQIILLAIAITGVAAETPDTILINGKILRVDSRFSIDQAIAIRDGKVLALGSTTDIRKLAGADSHVIDLGGRTVIPGLIDSHIHAIRAGLS